MTAQQTRDFFGARTVFQQGNGQTYYYRLARLEELGLTTLSRLPFSIRTLLEAVLRENDGFEITSEDVVHLAQWSATGAGQYEIPVKPARVLLQDFTGVPCLVDLASMRDAMGDLGCDPLEVQPQIPVDLVIDHSLQVDHFGTPEAPRHNASLELQRNRERYEFMHWGQKAFKNLRVIPPGNGIVHQINLEYLARGVCTRQEETTTVIFPDSVLGADSHTTMINSLGIIGWGVGGIEAEAAMLGQPIYIVMPEVIGVKVIGRLTEGVTATDVALTVTQMLRKKGVVEKFVEFYGPALSQMPLPDRATISNMSPEYGATMGFFPVDAESLNYLRRTGRSESEIALVEQYYKAQGLFRTEDTPDPEFTDTVELDLDMIEPSISGPKRPQDRVRLADVKTAFQATLRATTAQGGFAVADPDPGKHAAGGIGHGAVVIAAITSCTNTSNPSVMIGAGLLAKKAVERGLGVPKYVKTSMAPGSRVVAEYLKDAGLIEPLAALGFNIVGYGCTTCIGNSGPLPDVTARALAEDNIVGVAVLSGNRNFEGRISPLVKANYLASPPLVVAYALAGTIAIDFSTEPLGSDNNGQPVFLRDLWPGQQEIAECLSRTANPDQFRRLYHNIENANPDWTALPDHGSLLYPWSGHSTYIQKAPFFDDLEHLTPKGINRARVLALFGDSITTDHISPAGSIPVDSPAGRYLIEQGIDKKDFNQYGTRRGNDRVMVRGTFANIRIKNRMVPDREGGVTVHYPDGVQMPIFDATMRYRHEGVPIIVIAGREYGTGSSRDWAAKGTALLGVRAVLAESFERTHRSNLVGMGVLPLQFKPGQSAASLGLTGQELVTVEEFDDPITSRQDVVIKIEKLDGESFSFTATVRLDTPVEVRYYMNGGILPTVLRKLARR